MHPSIPFLLFLACTAAAPALGADPKPAPPGGEAANMAQAHQHDAPVPTAAAQTPPAAEVRGSEVVYAKVGGRPVRGYLARPRGGGSLPGLIVIHEWWGFNDNVRAMVRRLAAEGYLALGVDLYGGQQASDSTKAEQLMKSVDVAAASDNLKQAYAFLAAQQKATKVGVIGWCFGGGWALQTALLLPDKLSALVMYYGHPVTDPEKLRPLTMPILGLYGAEDRSIPVADVRAFEQAL